MSDKLAGEYGIKVALESSNPQALINSLEGRSSRMGVGADIAAWEQAGINPADGLKVVNDRLLNMNLTEVGAEMEPILLRTDQAESARNASTP